jgi:hypothetical protein
MCSWTTQRFKQVDKTMNSASVSEANKLAMAKTMSSVSASLFRICEHIEQINETETGKKDIRRNLPKVWFNLINFFR